MLGFAGSFSFVAVLLNAVTRLLGFDPNILRDAATLLVATFGLFIVDQSGKIVYFHGGEDAYDRSSGLFKVC